MANIVFQAVNPAGHFGIVSVPGRSSTTIDIQNASYNNVKVYPTLLAVSNSSNDGAVQVIQPNGFVNTVAARSNDKVVCTGVSVVTITNTGKAPCQITVLDVDAEKYGGSVIAASDLSSQNRSDYLFHFDTGTTGLGVNSGAEINGSISVDLALVATPTNAKFGAGCMQVVAAGDRVIVFNAGFVDVSADFTYDMWIRKTASIPGRALCGLSDVGQIQIREIAGDALQLFINPNTTNSVVGVLPAGGSMRHLALVKRGSLWRLSVDGVVVITINSPALGGIPKQPLLDGLIFGDILSAGAGVYYDEVRYIKGTAVWDGNFTPPSIPYV